MVRTLTVEGVLKGGRSNARGVAWPHVVIVVQHRPAAPLRMADLGGSKHGNERRIVESKLSRMDSDLVRQKKFLRKTHIFV